MKRQTLSKTGIEYGTHSWNPATGCRHQEMGICYVKNCWARAMARRQGDDFTPKVHPERLLAPLSLKKPARILVSFMGDMFGDWVDPNQWVNCQNRDEVVSGRLSDIVRHTTARCPQHRFLFLTKNPSGYAKWGKWPDNCWLGATVTDEMSFVATVFDQFRRPKLQGGHLWLSVEPLAEAIHPCKDGLDALAWAGVEWIVLGGQTRPTVMPQVEWVKEIVDAADNAGIPVWLKQNLWPLLGYADLGRSHIYSEQGGLRQELPEGLKL